jgi:hypothetical protein
MVKLSPGKQMSNLRFFGECLGYINLPQETTMSPHALGRSSARRLQSDRAVALREDIDLFLGQQDTLSALMVWILLEGLSCLVVPTAQLIPGDDKWVSWILISAPLGIIGALLIGTSSSLVEWVQEKFDKRTTNKKLWVLLSQMLGWIGLAGVGLPLILVGLELGQLIFKGTP